MQLQSLIKESKRPFLIAGPCAAESEEQVHTIVQDLAKNDAVNMLRAGIWKPRTRPNSFEGLGEIALPWLVDAAKNAGLPCCVEVANSKHVELALKAGVSALWVGARTTVNPFTVQEIADAVKGTSTPILIKNPVNPDLNLWLGAFERFQQAGCEDLTAIHRGFSSYQHPKYRNVPSWEIPIALHEKLPQIPLICDPSHIGGKRDLLLELSQKALDLNFNGLMIETHPNPDKAWSDSAQQITAEQLKTMCDQFVLRSKLIENEISEELTEMRTKIGILDERLFEILSARMLISEEIGLFKAKHNITILQEEHWKNLIDSCLEKSDEFNLTRVFIRNVMDNIHQESIRHQTKVMNQHTD